MTKKLMILMAFCFAFNGLNAQEESPLTKTWTLGFTLIGAEAISEFPVSQKSTIKVAAGGLFTGRVVELDNEFDFQSVGLAYASASYRYYYKFKDINRKSKPLFYNSGNYFYGELAGYQPLYYGSEFDSDFYGVFNIGWGLQRMYQNKFVFGFSIGPGINISSGQAGLYGDLTFGIRLSPKENN